MQKVEAESARSLLNTLGQRRRALCSTTRATEATSDTRGFVCNTRPTQRYGVPQPSLRSLELAVIDPCAGELLATVCTLRRKGPGAGPSHGVCERLVHGHAGASHCVRCVEVLRESRVRNGGMQGESPHGKEGGDGGGWREIEAGTVALALCRGRRRERATGGRREGEVWAELNMAVKAGAWVGMLTRGSDMGALDGSQ